MPLPRRLARFNLAVTNRVTGPFAGRLPGFAVIEHIGRRTGRTRRTPVNLFRAGDRYVVALTYGRDSQWVRNVLAAGGCEALTHGRRVRLVDPDVVHDPGRTLVPRPVAVILAAIGVEDFMTLRARLP
jgi:deazaflavin-dependent oxidoreductase (nitroreductase family)